jgi:hypothetical protein
MAIIYTYPVKSTPANDDLILISDSADSKKTKQIKVSSLPGGSSSGVSSFNTLTGAVTITGGTNVTLNTVGNNIEINAAGGSSGISVQGAGGTPITGITTLNFRHNFTVGAVGTTATMDVLPYGNDTEIQFKNGTAFGASPNLTFATDTLTVEHTAVIKGQGTGNPAGKLKLNCEANSHALTLEGPAHSGGADYTLKFPSSAPGNTQILQSNNSGQLSWITTPSGGGGGVSQVTAGGVLGTSSGAPISISPTTGNVVVTSQAYAGTTNVGHVPSGGSSITFLRGDGTWVTPTNTTYSVMGSGNSYAAGLVLAGNVTHSDQYLRKDGTWGTPLNTNAVDTVSAGTSGASSGSALTVSPTTGAVKVTSNSYAGTSNVGHVPAGGSSTTFLRGDGTWVVPTDTTSIALTTTGTSGASTWNGTTLNIPQYSGGGGSSASLGFTPLSIYEADDLTVASYTYYVLLVCDVDVTLANAKVFVRSGTSAIYAALYSTTTGNMQTSSFTRLGTFSKTSGVATGINILPVDGTVTLTAGQTIMLGFSSANQMAGGGPINSNALGVETTSLTSVFPASIPSIENTTNALKRVAIHFYAS